MSNYIYGITVLFPILMGFLIVLLPFKNRTQMMIYIETVVILTSLLVYCMVMKTPEGALTLFRFQGNLSVTLKLDGLGGVFATMIAFLWPLAVLFSFEYMKHEGHEKYFFMFYVVTYGITLGVCEAENILTLYVFYEMLSLITLPLIMHTLTREAIHASRTYFYYMIGGAAFAFIGMIFILVYGTTSSFVPGGVLDMSRVAGRENFFRLIYVMCFCGFGVKAAIFPFSAWLPKAGVAPTPVTALLHAVAVVKTGVFAVMRITYFSFGTDLVKDSWAQNIVMSLAIITIVFGSAKALKETHIKRRLAWSTVSNLSYILFSISLMSPAGLEGAMRHMLAHAFMKICAFFCAGAIIYKTGCNYIHELDGFGRKMPKVFAALMISGMGLMGVPGLCGFVSKWHIVEAATENGSVLAYLGVAALMISALLTAIYMLTISIRAFFPGKSFDYSQIVTVEDPNWMMILPLACFVIMMVLLGFHSQVLSEYLNQIISVL